MYIVVKWYLTCLSLIVLFVVVLVMKITGHECALWLWRGQSALIDSTDRSMQPCMGLIIYLNPRPCLDIVTSWAGLLGKRAVIS